MRDRNGGLRCVTEWDEPADMTHASNAILAISNRVRIP